MRIKSDWAGTIEPFSMVERGGEAARRVKMVSGANIWCKGLSQITTNSGDLRLVINIKTRGMHTSMIP